MLETEPHKMRRKLLRMCLKLWTKATLRWSFFAKIVNCFYSWALFVKKLRCKDIFIVCFNIVSSKVGTPLLWGNPPPPFLGTPSFWSKFKKLIPSFWEPSKLVHANCKKHFKMKVLCFVLYQVKWEHHWHCTLYLLLYLLLTLSLVTYCL